MNTVIFAPLHNSHGKKDATGAFQPEAAKFCTANGLPRKMYLFDNRQDVPMYERREFVLQTLQSKQAKIDVLAFFCHGWRDGIQAGFRMADIGKLVAAIAPRAAAELRVLLYACDTGRDGDGSRDDEREPGPGGDGGFADVLRDKLCAAGVRATVFAHSTPGHTTTNPYVRVFPPDGLEGGHWVVEPGSDRWAKWCRALRETDLRFAFPFMSAAEIESALVVPPAA